jgi:hypothetical protein
MAMGQCNECGQQVSKKAQACPHCGVAYPAGPTQYGCGSGCLVLILAVMAVGVWSSIGSEPSTSTASSASPNSKGSVRSTPSVPSWRNTSSIDEMTGVRSGFAISPRVPPTNQMGFPYTDVEAWIGVGCDGEDEWAYIGFTEAPNLVNDDTKDGYSVSQSRVRWDDEIVTTQFRQTWGAEFLHFMAYAPAISRIQASNSVMVEVAWYGEGTVRFQFSLNGSSAAVSQARTSCN